MKYVVIVLLMTLFLAGCMAKPNQLKNTQNSQGEIAGFFLGFWHGLISIITLILSLFSSKVTVYEVHNTGFFYNLGFLLGAGVLTGGTLWSRKKK